MAGKLDGQKSAKDESDVFSAKSFLHVKGYLAILVLIHHLYQFTGFLSGSSIGYALNLLGHFAVVEFLFMSGFGVWSSYIKKGNDYINGFLKKRVLPLYLTYLFFVIIYVVYAIIMKNELSASLILRSLTYGGTIVSFGWFFQVILLLYLLFYFCRRFVKNDGLFWTLMVVGVVIIISVNFLFAMPKNTYVVNASFLVGMVMAEIKNKYYDFYRMRTLLALAVSAAVFAGLALCTTLMDYRLSFAMKSSVLLDLSYLLVMTLQDIAFVVFIFYLLYCINRLCEKVLINPVSLFLGEHSLEIYALQGVVLGFLRTVISKDILFAVASICLVIFLSVPMHVLTDAIKAPMKKG